MDSVTFGLKLADTVREAIAARVDPINQKLNKLSLALAKVGSVKTLQLQIEKQQLIIEQQEQRIKRLEQLGTELEIHLAQSAGVDVGQRSSAVQ